MPNVLSPVGNSGAGGQTNDIATNDVQQKLCAVCSRPLTLETEGRQESLCGNCEGARTTTTTSDTQMTSSTTSTEQEMDAPQEKSLTGTVSDVKASRGALVTSNGSTKPTLKVVKVEFPESSTEGITPTSPQTSRTLSIRSPVSDQHALSGALRAHMETQSLLDPFVDFTRMRVSSRGYDCLYPGALFEGLQTNKTKEHRVSVRIVDVNMEQSRVEGFLTIHDLTEQWPEITTFFEGQIIGNRHGFVTGDWGASEKTDFTHWQQFPPYHQILASELVKPRQTLKNSTSTLDRGFVFMRWKERFLVPDHRVTSINGASYAGFYYICLEFGSLMGGLHGDALRSHAEEDDGMEEGSKRTASRSRRLADGYEDEKYDGYQYGSSSYASTPGYSAPSSSPIDARARLANILSSHGRRRTRRTSIYSAGSVASHAHDQVHSHSHTHPSSTHIPGGYGADSLSLGHDVTYISASSNPRDTDVREGDEMNLEEALELDPVEELHRNRHRQREQERMSIERSRSRTRSRDVGRYTSRERMRIDVEDEGGREWWGYGSGKRWMGSARLTGYYNHSEKDHCDLYQKLELHHVPDRTRGSFEFR